MTYNPFSRDGGETTSIQRTTAHESVRERIREAILGGRLPAGSRLVQSEIAGHLGVSTTPVREALRDLASEGLVEFDSFRGAVVHELSFEEVEEVYELRGVLEPVAIRRAVAHITPEELGRAEGLTRQMERETDPARWTELNREFHGILLQPGISKRLHGILRSLRDAASAYVAFSLTTRPDRMAIANDDHRGILDAYRDGYADRAVELATHHLAATVDIIRLALTEERATS